MLPRLLIILLLFLTPSVIGQSSLYEVISGKVFMNSDAPLENIKAETTSVRGLMNIADNSFAFTVDVRTFKGFNSALQQEHFHENYMESEKYPKAKFTGKLIDKFNPDLSTQKIRAKGKLEIHGISQERIVEVNIQKKNTNYTFTSQFNVPLADHGITIPRIVFQKIAETIAVTVNGELASK